MSTPKKKPASKAKPAKKPAARPIATQSATPQPAQFPTPMIRLRLPSEKPTRQDGDKDGYVLVFWDNGQTTLRLWSIRFESAIIAWLPGRLPEGLMPREPTQEERWQAEFEACFPDFDLTKQHGGGYLHAHAATAWRAFLAAKKRGAK